MLTISLRFFDVRAKTYKSLFLTLLSYSFSLSLFFFYSSSLNLPPTSSPSVPPHSSLHCLSPTPPAPILLSLTFFALTHYFNSVPLTLFKLLLSISLSQHDSKLARSWRGSFSLWRLRFIYYSLCFSMAFLWFST